MFCNVIHVVRLTCLYSGLLASCMMLFYSLCDDVFVDNVLWFTFCRDCFCHTVLHCVCLSCACSIFWGVCVNCAFCFCVCLTWECSVFVFDMCALYICLCDLCVLCFVFVWLVCAVVLCLFDLRVLWFYVCLTHVCCGFVFVWLVSTCCVFLFDFAQCAVLCSCMLLFPVFYAAPHTHPIECTAVYWRLAVI